MGEHRPSRLVAWFYALWGAFGLWSLAGAFAITWMWPYTFGETTVHRFTFMMLLEFLVVHSTGFFSAVSIFGETRMSRGLSYFGLVLVYCIFAAGFSAMYGSLWPVLAFLMLALPQFPTIVMQPLRKNQETMLGLQWSGLVLLYLGGAMFTLLYDIPELGISAEVIARQEFGVGGEWPEQPYRVMAFGCIYFTGKGLLVFLLELFGTRTKSAEVD